MNQIKNRFTRNIICEGEKNIKELAEKNKANLREADLRGANLREANMWGADLWGADLMGADLWRANLRKADLWRANLWGADLMGADLWRANLWGADLWGAENFEFWQFPSIRLISSIQLNNLPDNLQIELMRRDAFGHPHPEKFDEWAKTNRGFFPIFRAQSQCPYQNEERFWLFEPNPKLWQPGLPQMADRDLIRAICKSQGWRIKGYDL